MTPPVARHGEVVVPSDADARRLAFVRLMVRIGRRIEAKRLAAACESRAEAAS